MTSRDIWRVSDEYGEDAAKPLPWYPGNLAWHLNFSRKQLRKNQALESFHEFLKHESEVGNITRQEAVSMVPPLFLNIQPDHHILDMCAAPGSKTFQLLEMIHQSKEPSLLPTALVVANDANAQRCDLLIHNTKRMCTANLVVTNHEAQNFPDCCLANDPSEIYRNDCKPQRLEFDRVLCDVPCSGDGTIRKGHDMWRKWNSGMGNALHLLQVDISMRGIALLKVGGRMVYSTCSMNPVENEAVIAELLRRSGTSIELLDVSNELPELVRRPGLSTWKVKDRGSWFHNHEDIPYDRKNVILPSMFPSSEGQSMCENIEVNTDSNRSFSRNFNSEKTSQVCYTNGVSNSNSTKHFDSTSNSMSSNFPLHRCMRIVPHDQDTGAFFIAVIRKLSPLNEGQKEEVTKTEHILSTDRALNFHEESQSETVPPGKTAMHQQKIGFEVLDDDEPLEDQKKICIDGCTSKDNLSKVSLVSGDVKNDQAESGNKMKLQGQCKWIGVDPVLFFKDVTVIKSIVSFFGINISFPLEGHLVTRSADTDNARRIYYVSKSVQKILQLNVQVGEQLKIASIGLKMFERHRSKDGCPCAYRLSYEGLPLLLPYITKRILCASPNDFLRLLQYRTVNFAHFIDARFGEEAASLLPGCCVVILHEGHQHLDLDSITMDPTTIAIVCWRGKATLNAMVSPPDRKELVERITHRFGFKAFKVEEDENPQQED
ncbi:RNA cytosine-C(5)-methyltransferase NSUN2 isoform X2 [Oryza brachyantha]|uniref:RNA cytosine-C(5)-methyltransferase NSUN2 isoform X2 n=1 Tax=Oryza brachyantha TaxID=4533 RepID=UPI00077620B3|nr:RNA cytosine-C(5)-methyltransferase NSUN2 isoform X2 [Oryza brachyantha]